MYLPNPTTWARCDAKSIYKQILTGLNLEFSSSKISCHTKMKKHSQPNYLPIAGERIDWFIFFSKVLALNTNSLIQDLNSGRHAHFL